MSSQTPKTDPFKPAETTPKAPAVPAHKTPRDGTRSKENPGAITYKTGGMIRVSKILTRFHQELEVQEDEPGESILLRPAPPQG